MRLSRRSRKQWAEARHSCGAVRWQGDPVFFLICRLAPRCHANSSRSCNGFKQYDLSARKIGNCSGKLLPCVRPFGKYCDNSHMFSGLRGRSPKRALMGFFSNGSKSMVRAAVTGKHRRISNPWHAVEVCTGFMACPACQLLSGKRFLSSEAPSLPVAGCLRPLQCRAVYVHHDDRRAGPRRDAEQPGAARIGHSREGVAERRIGRGRRSADAPR